MSCSASRSMLARPLRLFDARSGREVGTKLRESLGPLADFAPNFVANSGEIPKFLTRHAEKLVDCVNAHPIQNVAGFDSVAHFGDRAGSAEPRRHDFDGVGVDLDAVHRREGSAPRSKHLLGIAETRGGVPPERPRKEAAQPDAKRGIEAIEGNSGLFISGPRIGLAVRDSLAVSP